MFPVPSLGSLIEQPKVLRTVAIAGAGLVVTQWALADLLHVPGGGFGLIALGGGLWWLSRPSNSPGFKSPSTVQGWVKRCDAVLDQFDDLEAQTGTPATRLQRQQALDRRELLRPRLWCQQLPDCRDAALRHAAGGQAV